jgi:hypothetical protein
VSNGCDDNLAWIDAINDSVRKAPEPALARELAVSRVDLWKLGYAIKGINVFLPEPLP